jgi:hypothetical protein
MKTTVIHQFLGRITYDTQTDQVTVQRGDLEERLTWLLKAKNEELLGPGYYPDPFLRACEVLGIAQGIENITTEGAPSLPPGTVY